MSEFTFTPYGVSFCSPALNEGTLLKETVIDVTNPPDNLDTLLLPSEHGLKGWSRKVKKRQKQNERSKDWEAVAKKGDLVQLSCSMRNLPTLAEFQAARHHLNISIQRGYTKGKHQVPPAAAYDWMTEWQVRETGLLVPHLHYLIWYHESQYVRRDCFGKTAGRIRVPALEELAQRVFEKHGAGPKGQRAFVVNGPSRVVMEHMRLVYLDEVEWDQSIVAPGDVERMHGEGILTDDEFQAHAPGYTDDVANIVGYQVKHQVHKSGRQREGYPESWGKSCRVWGGSSYDTWPRVQSVTCQMDGEKTKRFLFAMVEYKKNREQMMAERTFGEYKEKHIKQYEYWDNMIANRESKALESGLEVDSIPYDFDTYECPNLTTRILDELGIEYRTVEDNKKRVLV